MDKTICPNCGKDKKPWFPVCWECSEKESKKQSLLNSTAIGKEIGISNQRINLIFSELGWVEKDVTGWKVTKQGKGMGGRQFESEQGQTYVKWPESILENSILLEATFKPTNQKQANEIAVIEQTALAKTTGTRLTDKYPATHKALDGHFVRSRAELLIDNFLYHSGLVHAYERKLQTEEDLYCDFYIPSGNGRPQAVWIEFWGLEDDPKYLERKKRKIEVYKQNEWPLIELRNADIENLEEVLTRLLLKHKIKVAN